MKVTTVIAILFLAAAPTWAAESTAQIDLQNSELRPSLRVCNCWGWSEDAQHPDFKGRMTVNECIDSGGTNVSDCD